MKKLDNLMGAVGSMPSDEEIMERYGAEIEEIKSSHLQSYINGLVEMVMEELKFTDKQIDDVIMGIANRYHNERPADVLIWEWTHMTE